MTPPKTTYTIVLDALPDPAAKHGERFARDPAYRLKLLLKHALRGLGFRCRSVTPHPPPVAPAPQCK